MTRRQRRKTGQASYGFFRSLPLNFEEVVINVARRSRFERFNSALKLEGNRARPSASWPHLFSAANNNKSKSRSAIAAADAITGSNPESAARDKPRRRREAEL